MKVYNPIANSYTKNQANNKFVTVDMNDVNQGEPPISIETKLVPAGGTAGQVLAKSSNEDYETEWTTPQSGGNNLDIFVTNDNNILNLSDGTSHTSNFSYGGATFTFGKNTSVTISAGYRAIVGSGDGAIYYNIYNGPDTASLAATTTGAMMRQTIFVLKI